MGNSAPSILYATPINNPDKQPNETPIYRAPPSVGLDLNNLMPQFRTLHDILRLRFQSPMNDFIGRREIDPSTGQLQNFFSWKSNQQIQIDAECFGSGLLNLGLCPELAEQGMQPLRMLGIYSKNTVEYLIADIAGMMQCISIVPIYDTLGEESTVYTFRVTKMATCLVTSNHVEKLLKEKQAGKLQYLHNLIVPDLEKVSPETIRNFQGFVRFFSFEDIIRAGVQARRPWAMATPDHVYCFSFTSGTVGEPKGAYITHRNIISLIPGIQLKANNLVHPGDSYISYLPMAHVLERAVFVVLIYLGVKIGVYSGDVMKISDDAQILKPAIFVSVPRMFSKIHDGIRKTVDEQTPIKKNLFHHAIQSKLASLEKSGKVTHPIYDQLVFRKIRARLGGNVRFMITGSAPIDGSMLKFLKCVFCCPMLEGYGQTEACGIEFVTDLRESGAGHVGGPQLQNEYKLVDVPEMNYFSTDRDQQGNLSPRGEIWVRGPNVIPGYFLNPEQTRETFSPDGWLKSGDVGQILFPNNALRIIDRKKNIFKLQQGEYIAPEKLENAYKLASPFVNEIFVYGDGLRTCVVAIVHIDPPGITKLAQQFAIPDADPLQLKDSPEFLKKLCALLNETGKQNKFNSLEMLKGVFVDTRAFADNGLLTATFKLKRKDARTFYEREIDKMYSALPTA